MKQSEMSRADQVRQRRESEGARRAQEAIGGAVKPATPLTVRSGTPSRGMATPLPQQPAARRRAQAEVAVPGMRIAMPAISFSSSDIQWRILSFLVILAASFGIYSFSTSTALAAGPVLIKGNVRIPSEEITASLGVAGRPIFMLIPSDLSMRLRASEFQIQSAKVSVALPNNIAVSIVERQPVVRWCQNGECAWLDASGVAFRPRDDANTPLLTIEAQASPPSGVTPVGDPATRYASEAVMTSIAALMPELPSGSNMVYDSQYGFGWEDPRGWKAYFGASGTDMPVKLDIYKALVTALAQKGLTPVLINVQYPSAPYYRMGE